MAIRTTLVAAVVVLTRGQSIAQPPIESTAGDEEGTALAKQTQNPVADLVSVPIQMNFNSGGGLSDGSSILVNVQPVLPIHATQSWNVIARTIVSIASVPETTESNATGLGDIQLELFATPAGQHDLVWGVGPILSFPTATLDALQTGSWGVGPAALVVYTSGAWVLGTLATQTWSIADYGDSRDVNTTLLQPFANYNFGGGWAVTSAPVITANWSESDNRWTVPLGGGVNWTTAIGGHPMNLGVQYYRNVTAPVTSGDNQLRLVIAFLFPQKKHSASPPTVAQSTNEK